MVESDGSKTVSMPPPRKRRLSAFARRPYFIAGAGLVASVLLLTASVLTATSTHKGGIRAVAASLGGPLSHQLLPEFIADLKTVQSRPHYVQLAVVVELPEEAVTKLREEEAPILAETQTLLRDRQRQDLVGAAGTERLRGDILAVIDRHIAPAKARTVLFTKFLVD